MQSGSQHSGFADASFPISYLVTKALLVSTYMGRNQFFLIFGFYRFMANNRILPLPCKILILALPGPKSAFCRVRDRMFDRHASFSGYENVENCLIFVRNFDHLG